ncbi:hypothetical protein [Nostoc sp.]
MSEKPRLWYLGQNSLPLSSTVIASPPLEVQQNGAGIARENEGAFSTPKK